MAQTPERRAAAQGCLGAVAGVCLVCFIGLSRAFFNRRGYPSIWDESDKKVAIAALLAGFFVVGMIAMVGLLLVGRTKERPPYWREFLERGREKR